MRMNREFWKRLVELTVGIHALAAVCCVQAWTHSVLLGWLCFGTVAAILVVLFNLIFFRDEFELPSIKEFVQGVVSLSLYPLVILFALIFMVLCSMVLSFSYEFVAALWEEMVFALVIFLLIRLGVLILRARKWNGLQQPQPRKYSAVIVDKEIK